VYYSFASNVTHPRLLLDTDVPSELIRARLQIRATLNHGSHPDPDPHGEQLVAAHLRTGRYHSPEEVVTRALETLAEREPPMVPTQAMTPAEAVADIRELRKGVTLGGLRIRNLINEGRKY